MECKHLRTVKVGHEIVCAECGLVLSDIEFEHLPKRDRISLWDFTSFAETSDTLTGKERTELTVMTYIDTLSSKLSLPKRVSADAMLNARKILSRMRLENHVRLTSLEIAIAALWLAIKKYGMPVTMREYAKTVGFDFTANKLFRLLDRTIKLVSIKTKLLHPKEYIPRIFARLSADPSYISSVELYAARITENVWEILKSRSPLLVAATAVYIADEYLGGRIGLKLIAKAAGVGVTSIIGLGPIIRKAVPPPPTSAIRFLLSQVKESEVNMLCCSSFH
jgi:transcription initiation factor TFIIIB Brf1 subunit/transcription initiation factor TFIIB